VVLFGGDVDESSRRDLLVGWRCGHCWVVVFLFCELCL
jgi:hypothetical protein